MKSFAKIYHGCWHTPDNPCRFFVDCINNGPHCNQSAEAKEELSAYKKELLLEHHASGDYGRHGHLWSGQRRPGGL